MSGAAALLAVASTCAVGFVSPNAANLPIIGAVFDLLRDQNIAPQDIQQAVIEGYGQRINQSVTDNGITLTIGNVYCDQNQLAFDMVESSVNGDTADQVFVPSDQTTTLTINGQRSLINISGGEFCPTQNGRYAGIVYNNAFNTWPYRPFPKNFQLDVQIHQVGSIHGSWHFVIPVSQARVLAATKVFSPMKTVSDNGRTVKVKRVIVGPAQTLIDYQVTDPVASVGTIGGSLGIPDISHITVLNNNSGVRLLDAGGGPISSAQIRGDTVVQEFQAVFMTPRSLPASFTIQVGLGPKNTAIVVPLK
ncbi:DUF4179 domain-containing protein [Alicyclobacillus kakegawensis]|uniref:DUF4179 domain-containing protein n=1 Tax=Alicyclobacillus kakegawensis TaxID=392012 RepID=UPI0014702C5B|nr:DUF4179 domain-containing protein [Alicyclobacillus kakegawensis]